MEFWQGKKIFLTGHTGFKGSWLSIWLQQLGASVTGYSLEPPTSPSLFKLAKVSDGMQDIRGDVRDIESLNKALRESQAEIVIHMAAQSLVRDSYSFPVETYSTNVMGTVHVLEAARLQDGVRTVLNITSDKCYENSGLTRGYNEDDPMGGYDPYSSSKGCAELVTSAYRNSYFNGNKAVASARAGNVIGGGDWAKDRLVPDIIRAAMNGRTVLLRNPHAIRPWQHVLDPLSGYLMLIEKLYTEGQPFAQGWNFGPSEQDTRPVEWIAQKIAALCGGLKWEKDNSANPHEAHYLKLDCSKARTQLAWKPRFNLQKALEWTVLWYKRQAAGEDMRSTTEEQIKNYTGLPQA
ncbi:CDP-glucose 4,6-dehydratase [Thermodesulfobacteriota bacterium]